MLSFGLHLAQVRLVVGGPALQREGHWFVYGHYYYSNNRE